MSVFSIFVTQRTQVRYSRPRQGSDTWVHTPKNPVGFLGGKPTTKTHLKISQV